MKRNTKALLWVLAVFAVLAVGLYIGGCGEDEESTDAGQQVTDPCAGKQAGDACTGGYCVEKAGAGLICAKECTELGIDATCGTGFGCYPLKDKKVCLEAGTKKAGENCGAINACEAGLVCDSFTDVAQCWKICSTDDDCGGGTCEAAEGDGYNTKVCVAK